MFYKELKVIKLFTWSYILWHISCIGCVLEDVPLSWIYMATATPDKLYLSEDGINIYTKN